MAECKPSSKRHKSKALVDLHSSGVDGNDEPHAGATQEKERERERDAKLEYCLRPELLLHVLYLEEDSSSAGSCPG